MWNKLAKAKREMPKATVRDCIATGYFTEQEALSMIKFNSYSAPKSTPPSGGSFILGWLLGNLI